MIHIFIYMRKVIGRLPGCLKARTARPLPRTYESNLIPLFHSTMLLQGKLVPCLEYTDNPQTPDVSTLESQTPTREGYVASCQSQVRNLLFSRINRAMVRGQVRLFYEMADLVYFPPLSIKEDPLKKSTPNP